MPSFRHDKTGPAQGQPSNEPRDFAQLGLDFSSANAYISVPRKELETMNQELFETLEHKVSGLLEKYTALKEENARLAEENQRLQADREALKSRVDAILGKLEGI